MLFYQRSIDITDHRCKQSTRNRFSVVRFTVELLDWILMKFYSTTRLLSFMKLHFALEYLQKQRLRSGSGLKSFHVRCQRRLQLEWENGSVREKCSLRISWLAQNICAERYLAKCTVLKPWKYMPARATKVKHQKHWIAKGNCLLNGLNSIS